MKAGKGVNLGITERFFLFGIKKVITIDPTYPKFNILINQFPYVDKELFPPLEDDYIFFYDEYLKKQIYNQYLKENIHIKKFSPEFNRIMGTILGYPPKAVDYYVDRMRNEKLTDDSIGLYFCGVECVSGIEDLAENVEWLWKKYPYPNMDVLTACYKRQYIEFEYEDIAAIRNAQKAVVAKIEKEGTLS